MKINFDMDGTIADLYGVENWLDYLIAESTLPYEMAKPLLNLNVLARILNRRIRNGDEVNIISWTSKNGSPEYNARVAEAKKAWLARHLSSVKFTHIYIVPYGTPKCSLSDGVLFDDETGNRTAWGQGAYDVDNIIGTLSAI